MRLKTAVALLLIVVISTTTFPVTGQEEPLPAIQPKGSLAPLTPSVGRSIVLPAEPVALQVPLPTLEEAARANDYITFDALYRSAVQRGDSMAAFAPLHEIWTYGITDPIGAFYGPDIYERLVRAYPAFASYIAEYRIVDSNGNVFYPTSETRTFLLDRALEGRAPGVQLVEVQRSTPRVELRSTTPGSVWDRVPATSKRSTTSPRRSTAASKRSTATASRPSTTAARSGTPASSPAGTAASRRRTSPPKARKHVAAVATKREPKAAARDTSAPLSASSAGPAGGDASAPSKTPAPVVEKAPVVAEKPPVVAEKTPVASDTATTTAEAPVVVRAEPAATDTSVPAPQPIATDSNFGGRGILLLVIGLIGVGLLAMMLRAPREVPSSIMQPPDAVPPPGDKPTGPTPVEPLRRPQAAPEPPPPGKNRAGGSHG